jgi:post-segregation antitoxin (ccd killing protein)
MFAVKLITATQEQTNDMKDFSIIINEAFATAVKEAISQHKTELATMVSALVDDKIAAAIKNAPAQSETDEQFSERVKKAIRNGIDLEEMIDANNLEIDVSQAVDDYLRNSTVEIRIR